MSEPWTVEIAGNPPTINASYKIVYMRPFCPVCNRGTARLGKAPDVEVWQTAVAFSVQAARPRGWQPSRRVRIGIEWYMIRAGRDADGPLKACLDGIKVGLGIDDRIFLPTIISNEIDRAAPRTVLTLSNE